MADIGPKIGGYEKKGVQVLNFGFVTPKRHVLARNCVRLLAYFASKSVGASSLWAR